jgi:hypothetical protein
MDAPVLTYEKLSRTPRLFHTFTGLTCEEFDRIYAQLEQKYPKYEQKRLRKKNRKRAIGAGRKFKLPMKERVLMLLFYYRLYTNLALAGFLFDLNLSNVSRNITMMEPLVKACIPIPEKITKQTQRIHDLDELLELYPEMKAFIDATEQEIPRPKNKRRRKNYYSGKKKKHTVKTQIVVNKKGLILHKTKHRNGKQHDYDIFKKTGPPPIPPEVEIGVDLGYFGIEKDYPDLNVNIPVKKPKKKELTPKEKRYNKKQRKARVIVEHTIGRMKKFRIMGEEFRNRLTRYDRMTSIVCGLVNFTVQSE